MASVWNLRDASGLALAWLITSCAGEPAASTPIETTSPGATTAVAQETRGASVATQTGTDPAAGANATAPSTASAGRAATADSGDLSTAMAGQGPAGAGAAADSGTQAGAPSATAGSGAAGTNAGASSEAGSAGSAGASAGDGSEETPPGVTPVLRIPLRIHTGLSDLSEAELRPILQELNQIWLQQAGICFEIEVTERDENRTDGFDFRYTAGQIPIARGSNGVYQDAHTIWSIDHPRLNDVSMPVLHPAARTTAHELGHALGLAHENPPPSNDCSRPCHCVELGDDCDEYLMRSGSKGYFLSEPEVDTARSRAPRFALSDTEKTQCAEPVFME